MTHQNSSADTARTHRTTRTPRVDLVRQIRPRHRRRHSAGIVAQYIHELSERHAQEARRSRGPRAVSSQPC